MFSPPKFESPKRINNTQIQKNQDMSNKTQATSSNSQFMSTIQGSNQTPLQQKLQGDSSNQQPLQNQPIINNSLDNNSLINNLIFGYRNSQQQELTKQAEAILNKQNMISNQRLHLSSSQRQSYQKEQVTAFNPNIGSNVKPDNSFNQSNDYYNNSGLKNQVKSSQFQNVQQIQQQHSQHMSAADYLMLTGNKISCGNANCNCSESSWALVRDYLRQLKQMSSEHLFVSQENKRFSEANQELLSENLNLKNQIAILEQKMVLYEKENNNKFSSAKDKIKSLEVFNKDLFNKITFYEQAILNYEQEIKNIKQDCFFKIQIVEEERDHHKQNVETLHETMSEAIASCENRYKTQIKSKNSEIKQLKNQSVNDKNLIESYYTELVQLQNENKSLKEDLEAIQQLINNLQFEQDDTVQKFQMQEIELQAQIKQADELRKKNEELSNHIAILINNQQIEGEDKLKAFQHINQQQISQLYNENQELRKELHEWQEKAQVLKEGIELEMEKNINSIRIILTYIQTLIKSKGKEDIDEIDHPYMNQQYYQLDIFEEVKSKVLKLIKSRRSNKKKNKELRSINDDLEEQIKELQNTLHKVASDAQEEILKNDQLQIKINFIQQQLDDQIIQNQIQNRQVQEEQIYHNFNQQQQAPIAYMQRLSVKTGPQQHMQSQTLVNNQQWVEDTTTTTIQQTRNSQIQQFQTPSLSPSVGQGDLLSGQQIRKSIPINSNGTQIKINGQLLNSTESDQARYQSQIEEILTIKDTHYNTLINDLTKQYSETQTNNTCIIYILTKLIQNYQSRMSRLSGLLKQQTTIVFSLINSLEQKKKDENESSIQMNQSKHKLKVAIKQILFVIRLQQIKKKYSVKDDKSQKLLQLNLSKVSNEVGLKNSIKNIIKDIEGDFKLYHSIKQIHEGSSSFENEQSQQAIKFQQNNLISLLNLIDEKQKEYEKQLPLYKKQIQNIKIVPSLTDEPQQERQSANQNSANRQSSKRFSSRRLTGEEALESGRKKELIKEKEIIETENIQLKGLVINLKEELDYIQKELGEKKKQGQNYQKVIENYENQIQKLQNENEVHLEKNSKLIDMIDPKNRAILEQQPILDFFSNSNNIRLEDLLDSQEHNHVIEQSNSQSANQNKSPQ